MFYKQFLIHIYMYGIISSSSYAYIYLYMHTYICILGVNPNKILGEFHIGAPWFYNL